MRYNKLRKNNKVLLGLLIVVLLAVIGLSAYAYQKQKALNNSIIYVHIIYDD